MKPALLPFLAILFILLPARAEDSVPAETGFATICEIARAGSEDLRQAVLPGRLVEGRRDWRPEDTEKWRAAYCRQLASMKGVVFTGAGDRAVARIPGRRGDLAVLLRRDETRWIVDCAEPYVLGGRKLRATRGRRSARVVLEQRDDGSEYGPCAFSFGHVTQDPEKCKNMMDIWFCRCGRLHCVRKTGAIARVGAVALDKVEGLRGDWSFERAVAPEKGVAYAIHCRRIGHWDFFVKARVLSRERRSLTLEWELLALGPGAPRSIHETMPIRFPGDGADGSPGLCGKGRVWRPGETPGERRGTSTGK